MFIPEEQPSGFKPTQISGCVLWLRADLGITIGTGVSAWADQSGTGDGNKNCTQATGSKQPTLNASDSSYNGKPTLSFASASLQSLVSGTWASALSTPYTIVAVGNYDGTAANQVLCGAQSNNVQVRNANNGSGFAPMIYSGVALNGSGGLTASPLVEMGVFGTSGAVFLSAKTAVATGTSGTSAFPDLSVGEMLGGNFFLNGKVAEIIIYNSDIGATNRAPLWNYLGSRYGISIGS